MRTGGWLQGYTRRKTDPRRKPHNETYPGRMSIKMPTKAQRLEPTVHWLPEPVLSLQSESRQTRSCGIKNTLTLTTRRALRARVPV